MVCERLECICEKTISPPGERAPSPPPSQVRARAKSDFPHYHSGSPSLPLSRLSPPFRRGMRRGRRRAPRGIERARGDGRQRRRWLWLFLSFSLSGAHAAFLPMLAPLRSLLYSQCEFGRDRVRTNPAPRGTAIALDRRDHVLRRLIRKGQKRLQGKTATVPFPLLPSGLLRMDAEKFAEGRPERSTFLHRGRINNCEALRGPGALLAHRRRYHEMRSRVH